MSFTCNYPSIERWSACGAQSHGRPTHRSSKAPRGVTTVRRATCPSPRHRGPEKTVLRVRASSAATNDGNSDDALTITTFNVLAPCYRRVKQDDGTVVMEATLPEVATARQTRVVDALLDQSSSVCCLQEFWHANAETKALYESRMAAAGYQTFVTPRTGGRPDGLLTCVRSADFDVVEHRNLDFNDCGDRVASLLHLRSVGATAYDVLVVNTHLLFPHNANSTLIRLRECFKILEYLHEYQELAASTVGQAGGRARRLPVVMCGDFNGSIRGACSRFLQSQGFVSALEERRACECDVISSGWVSHMNHHGEAVGVDHVWLLNPSKQKADTDGTRVVAPPSWKAAIYAMIQCKMLEKGLISNEDAFKFFDFNEDLGVTRDEFEVAVEMLGLTGESTPGLLSEEIQTLYDDCDKDGNGEVDFSEFIKKLDVESMEQAYRAVCDSQNIEEGPWDVVSDLMAASASPVVCAGFTIDEDDEVFVTEPVFGKKRDLVVSSARLPDAMLAGEWPDDFDLSDHGPLTAVLTPNRR